MSDNDTTRPIPPAFPASEPDATEVLFPTAQPTPARRRPRFGTILWGVILLVFAAFMVTNALVPFVLDAGTWLIGALVAAGVVLVIAGIAAAVRSSD